MPRTEGSGGIEQYPSASLVEGDLVAGKPINGRVGTYRKEEDVTQEVLRRKVEEIEASIDRLKNTAPSLKSAIEGRKENELKIIGTNLFKERDIIQKRFNVIFTWAQVDETVRTLLEELSADLMEVATNLVNMDIYPYLFDLFEIVVEGYQVWFRDITLIRGETATQ